MDSIRLDDIIIPDGRVRIPVNFNSFQEVVILSLQKYLWAELSNGSAFYYFASNSKTNDSAFNNI